MNKAWLCIVMVVWAAASTMGQEAATNKPVQAIASPQEIAFLKENVRLEFRVAASNEPGLLVVTASPHYEAAVHFKGKDGEMGAEVSGEVRLDDRGIWVTYRLHLVTGGEGAVADYQIASSALLQPGQGMEIGNIGDKTVFLRASIVQGKSPAAAKKQPSE